MADLYEEILKMKGEGRRGALATVIGTRGSTPREAGAKLLVHEDGRISGTIGGGAVEAAVRQEAMRILREGKPRNFHFDLTGQNAAEAGMICGGDMHVYIEPVVPTPTAYIFGGGHIAVFVSRICSMVELEVVVIDDRQEFANRERFPEAREVIAEDFGLVFPRLKVNRSSFLIIVTRGHVHDQVVLEWALNTEAGYIGMIGSKRKTRMVYDNLKEKGVGEEALQRVHAPIGLDIGADTPEEIAVSIVAEMIQARRKTG